MAPTTEQQHAFLDAAKAFDFARVRALVEEDGAYVNVQPAGRFTALHQACEAGDAEAVQYLLSKGADVLLTTRDGQTAMDLAIKHGKKDVVRVINEHMKVELAAIARARRESFLLGGANVAPKRQ